MRKHSADFYIQLFKKLQQTNQFNGCTIHVKCLQYCFGWLIENDLNWTRILWNDHKVRKQAAHNNVHGKPSVMFELPEKYGVEDYKQDLDIRLVEGWLESSTTNPQLIDPTFKIIARELMPHHKVPKTPEDALILYKQLTTHLYEVLPETEFYD